MSETEAERKLRFRGYKEKWRARNRDKIKEASKRGRQLNPEKSREYYRNIRRQRLRTNRLCPSCGTIKEMFFKSTYCSNDCRAKSMRRRSDAERKAYNVANAKKWAANNPERSSAAKARLNRKYKSLEYQTSRILREVAQLHEQISTSQPTEKSNA